MKEHNLQVRALTEKKPFGYLIIVERAFHPPSPIYKRSPLL